MQLLPFPAACVVYSRADLMMAANSAQRQKILFFLFSGEWHLLGMWNRQRNINNNDYHYLVTR
jgi:hypothetical protein